MARFGRGQPHAPIFLRAPFIAGVVAAATVSPIHITLADRPQAYGKRTTIAYVRPSPSALVPDRLAPQFHIVTTQRGRRFTGDVLVLRNPQTPVVASVATGSPLHVVTLAQFRRAIRPDGLALYVRPSASSLVPDRLPVQIHVLQQYRRRADGAAVVLVLRNPASPLITPDRITQQIHVISPVIWRRAVKPDGSVAYIRPSRTSLVPAKLAPQIHVISRVGDRVRVRREPVLFYQHGSMASPLKALALGVMDLGNYRTLVSDDGSSVLVVSDSDILRYVAWDASAHRYYVVDASGHRYGVDEV